MKIWDVTVNEESFDVTFDDYHLRHDKKNGVTFILESDIPEGHGPINMGVIDYDSLFGLRETALDATNRCSAAHCSATKWC